MTPHELAEKIIEIIYDNHGPSTPDFSESAVTKAIESLLTDALAEAEVRALAKCKEAVEQSMKRPHLFDALVRAATLSAYEDCAKIAENKWECPDGLEPCDDVTSGNACHCPEDWGKEIAEKIRLSAKELK